MQSDMWEILDDDIVRVNDEGDGAAPVCFARWATDKGWYCVDEIPFPNLARIYSSPILAEIPDGYANLCEWTSPDAPPILIVAAKRIANLFGAEAVKKAKHEVDMLRVLNRENNLFVRYLDNVSTERDLW